LAFPEAALADVEHAISKAREIGQAATLMYALTHATFAVVSCGKYSKATAVVDELVALANERSAPYWKAVGILLQGRILGLTGKASEAVHMMTSESPNGSQPEQHFCYRSTYHIWRPPMRNLVSSMRLGAA
jgi:hypothetical protein